MPKFRSEVPKGLFRIPISITKEMEDWLRGLSIEIKSSGGYKLPKSYIIQNLNINVNNLKTQKELKEKMCLTFKEIR
jgi:hypothetical protein